MTWEQLELFEQWLPVVGSEGFYEVSNFGRVRSVARKGCKGRILIFGKNRDGYLMLPLRIHSNHKYRSRTIHCLVAEAFLGSCPPGKEIDHIDGDKTHNSVFNLRYVKHSENAKSAVRLRGKWQKGNQGEKHPLVKLSNAQVIEIRRLKMEGMKQSDIAREFRVSRSQISRIVLKQNRR
jgi:NUMOD4 motif/HNH endonuclease